MTVDLKVTAVKPRTGWADTQPSSKDLQRVGSLYIPSAFELLAQTHTSHGLVFEAVLSYEVRDGQLLLRRVTSVTHEVDVAIGALKRTRPWDEWKRLALIMLSADEVERSGKGDLVTTMRQAHATPVRRRRDRVTDDLLREVAAVYRRARVSGLPPTLEVAQHFYKSHSTAARWVSTARERGIMRPADGSRGGEVDSDE